jgi:hypothetical protein
MANTSTTTTTSSLDLTGSMSQVFTVQVPSGVPGLYVTGIDLYFASQSNSFGATMQLLQLTNGLPDPSTTLPGSVVTLNANQISTSNDASVATRFQFDSPIYLTANASYAFSVRGLGNSPDITLYTAVNGDDDIDTGVSVSANPLSGAAYYAKSSSSWQQIPNENIKYNIWRASFNIGSQSTCALKKAPNEIWQLTNLGFASGPIDIRAGDEIYVIDENWFISNTEMTAKVVKYDVLNNLLYLRNSTGNFETNTRITIVRTAVEGQVNANTDGMMAIAWIADIFDMPMDGIVPKVAVVNNPLTTASIQYRGTYKQGDPAVPVKETGVNDWINLSSDNETEFFDETRYALSYSNEVAELSGNTSVELQINMNSSSDYCSPAIDLNSHSIIGFQNQINSDIGDESGPYGTALSRYIGKTVTLADGQDAEDLQVYIDAYKPPGTEIYVYAKIWNNGDPDTFDSKPWSQLVQTTSPTLYSVLNNLTDYQEYQYGFNTTQPLINGSNTAVAGAAYRPPSDDEPDGGSVQYTTALGTFVGYQQFALKIVLAIDDDSETYNYPRMNDVRAIALQL